MPTSLRVALWALYKRDIKLLLRRSGDILNPIFFVLIVVSLFPIAIGPTETTLAVIAGGVIWVAALLGTMLSLETLFRTDFEDGTLHQLVISEHPLFLLVLIKITAHWTMTALPLILLTPILALFLNLPSEALLTLIESLLLGTPTLSLLGSIGVALTIAIKRGGLLLSILVLPLFVPVLILATSAIQGASIGHSTEGQLLILLSFLVMSLTLVPFATATALKISLS